MRSFRNFIDELENQDHLVRVTKPVRINGELAAVQWKIERELGKAVLFENVRDYNMKVAGNLYFVPFRTGIMPTIPMMKDLLSVYQGMKKPGIIYPIWATNEMVMQVFHEIENVVTKALQHPVKPKLVHDTELENTMDGDKIDILNALPVPQYFKEDAGRYITTGVTLARDPETGYTNAGIYRIQIIDKNKMAMMINMKRDLLSLITKAQRTSQKLEVAIAIGVEPELFIASSMSVPYGTSEIEIAGGFAGCPMELTQGHTIDLSVPAHAEVVIEGFIDLTQRVEEGPFTEYDLLASQKTKGFLINVTAVRTRKDAIYHSLVCTSREMVSAILPLGITEVLNAKAFLRHITPNVKDVWLMPGVSGVAMAVSIYKQHEAEPQEVIHALFAFSARLKRIIVVDTDIDVYDPYDVQWAIDTRVSYYRDIIVLEATGETTDAARIGDFSLKVGWDATKKKGHSHKLERSDLTQFERIELTDFLDNDFLISK